MSENELREAFRELTSDIKPSGPAYPRLMKRKQREHRVRTTGWATAAISTGLALLLVPLSFTAGDGGFAVPDPSASPGIEMISPSPPYSPPPPGPMTPWIRSMIDAPTRGDLAADQAFLSQASDSVISRPQFRPVIDQEQVKVLFAGDVGEFRVVIVAIYNGNAQSLVFMAGKRGAPLTELLPAFTGSSPAVNGMGVLEPFHRMAFRRLADGELTFASVALAPPGCAVATAGADLLWKDEPAGSYLASAQSPVGRSVRVTCEGTVRFEGAVTDSVIPLVSWGAPDTALAAAKQGMIGDLPDEAARNLIINCLADSAPRIRYAGPVPQLPGEYHLATCFDSDGSVEVRSSYHVGRAYSGNTQFIPADAPGVEVIGAELENVVVIVAPLATAEVQVTDQSGAVRQKIAISGGVGITSSGTTGRLRALDASGREIGLGAIAMRNPPMPKFPYPPTASPRVNDWR